MRQGLRGGKSGSESTRAGQAMLRDIVIGLLTAALTAVGFLVRRHLQKDRITEAITRKDALLALFERMKAKGVTMDELHEFEASLERVDRVRAIEDRLTVELKNEELDELQQARTQSEMNVAAGRNLARADGRLQAALAELRAYLTPEEEAAFNATQNIWEIYRDREGDFSAARFEGGTIQPLIRLSALAALTIERAATVEAGLEFRKSTLLGQDA